MRTSVKAGKVLHVAEKQCCILVKVRVAAGARREKVERVPKGLKVYVREPAEDNRANARVRELVAMEYGMPEKAVRLVSGHHSTSKTFNIYNG